MLTLPSDSARLEALLREGLAELGLETDAQTLERLERYYALLDRESRVMNLTAIHGAEDTVRLHFLDCAALLEAAGYTRLAETEEWRTSPASGSSTWVPARASPAWS